MRQYLADDGIMVCAFSGGRTSAYLAQILKKEYGDRLRCVFMNTGKENERTLEFVHEVDQHFGLGTVWIEAVINPQRGIGATHKVVSFETASRNGEPYEAMIAKYGLPSTRGAKCTRELKERTMKDWLRKAGLPSHALAIGIRADEVDRIPAAYYDGKTDMVYPLADLNVTKQDVLEFWKTMPFDLNLEEHQGNCDACFKKSHRKLLKVAAESPERLRWWIEMEEKYGTVKIDGMKSYNEMIDRVGGARFLRGHRSYKDLLTEAFPEAELDLSEGCEESCEPFLGDADEP
jgi:3'-phosphoadenosine 5'-phosphosulfate sulfotransferase (PAPS reductase)/FAD synthetase